MDVAKYIGLFLLKNHFCYIHGLGSLELKRKAASYDGQELKAPSYEVVLSPGGSIDDNLANFIASNEQISISKAANALRDFSTQARADLSAGKDVEIPAIGRFYEDGGKTQFATDTHFQYAPPSIPSPKVRKQGATVNEALPVDREPESTDTRSYMPVHTPSEEDEESGGLNWPRIILAAIVLLAVVALATYGIKRFRGGEDSLQPVLPTKENAAADTAGIPGIDTSAAAPSVNLNSSVENGTMKFKVIIDSYSDKAKAEKRTNTMRGWGHPVEMIAEDSNTYFVVIAAECPVQDTAKVLDSLRVLYNPGGVSIY